MASCPYIIYLKKIKINLYQTDVFLFLKCVKFNNTSLYI